METEQSHLFYHNCTKKFSYKIDKYNECKKSKCRHPQHIYITNDEVIKAGDYFWKPDCNMIFKAEYTPHKGCEKVILTTDQDLIKDGIQPIDDEFLEWFVKNPSCERVEVESWQTKGEWDIDYKIIIPKEEPKQETLEEIRKYAELSYYNGDEINAFVNGAKWKQEKMYSEEEIFNLCRDFAIFVQQKRPSYKKQLEWFEQLKKK
jgi:hypothetical protein